MNIENEQVQEIYSRWNNVWKRKENDLETRLKAYSMLEMIKALVLIYEANNKLDEDEIDDLFIHWNDKLKPLFPEDKPKLLESIEKQLKNLE